MSRSQRRRNRQRRQRGVGDEISPDIQSTPSDEGLNGDPAEESPDDRGWLSGAAWSQALERFRGWAGCPEGMVFLAVVLVAALLRFWDLGGRAVHHDESLHGYYSWFMADGGGFIHNPLLHGTVQFIATSFVFRILGDSDASLRYLPALLGTIVVVLPYLLFRHKMGVWASLIASGLLAISPGVLYFSRFARNDIYMALITLILFWTMWSYLDTKRFKYLVIASATLAIGFATKEIMYLLVLVPLTFLFIAHVGDIKRLLRTRLSEWPPGAVFGLILTTLVLPMGAAGISLFQNILGIHLANPDAGVEAAEGAIANLPGPVGSPISQGGGVTTWVIERLSSLPGVGFDLANLNEIQHPDAGTLFGLQALDIAALALLALFGAGAALGILWRGRRWLIISGVFWLLTITLFTTLYTNGIGLGSGVWQSLGYWVAQQDVGRGSQPWYYYFMVLFVYELLPVIAAFATGVFILRRRPAFLSFDVFLMYWLGLVLALLLMAGEKMPWLSIHLTLPIIFIASRGLGQYLPHAFNHVRDIARSVDPNRVGHAIVVGGFAVLLILTVQSSLRASFTNGDIPVEMLVYTQTSPALEDAVDEIDRYAVSTGVGDGLPLTIDTAHGYSWPWHWYLRDYSSVQYKCMGGESVCGAGSQPVTDENPPHGVIMAVNASSAPNIQTSEWGSDSANRVTIPLRWWFPEGVYRGEDYYAGLGVGDIVRGAFDPGAWSTIWTYWTQREPPWPLGRADIHVYFPADYTPEVSSPPDPVHGPAGR